jgi:hypothetical protein
MLDLSFCCTLKLFLFLAFFISILPPFSHLSDKKDMLKRPSRLPVDYKSIGDTDVGGLECTLKSWHDGVLAEFRKEYKAMKGRSMIAGRLKNRGI